MADAPAPSAAEVAAPRVSPERALSCARELWGVAAAAARPLPGERDANFHLPAPDGHGWVLKVSARDEEPPLLNCQDALLRRLTDAAVSYRFPRPVHAVSGETTVSVLDDDGVPHLARLLEYVPGEPLAGVRPHTQALLEEVGRLAGTVSRVLESFDHPAAHRAFYWDLRQGRGVIARYLPEVEDPARRDRVQGFLPLLDAAAPLLEELPTGVIHGDANDHNVLVKPASPSDPFAPARVVGLVDAGDVVHSWRAGEAAIAATYAMLGKPDPLHAAAAVARGFHAERPLLEEEIEALYPLVVTRLCTSVCVAAHQRRLRPENAYLSVSEADAWALLDRLADESPAFAHYVFRDACGLEPCPRGRAVAAWIGAHAAALAPVVEGGLEGAAVLDLGVGSVQVGDLPDRGTPREWTARIAALTGGRPAVGGWDEARAWYTAPGYRVEGNEGPEWRSVHLGVDLFLDPGTPVRTPLPGTVRSVRDNGGPEDYGPTVILEHHAGGAPFLTLWGHLARAGLEALEPGQRLAAGAVVGTIGAEEENGGWAPHLHLQVIADGLGQEGTFPGVARPRERRVWTSISPDPRVLAGVASYGVREGAGSADAADLLARRARAIGPNLSVSYRRPLHIVRGWMQQLQDADGRRYLDAVNNVPHVGHGHPRVMGAIAAQAAILNTNTRYLHPLLVEYAERLVATMPEPLSVCYFVCSGSEANELALRLARAHTGRRDVVVLEGAYHGNTGTLVDLSPYKHAGPGGQGAPDWVRVAPMPDPYRGLHRGGGPEVGRRYAEEVARVLEAGPASPGGGSALHPPAAFFAEPLLGCGGQIVPPEGWLAGAFAAARAAGAVCIADEVQIGFGRVGSHWWGFEAMGAVPDVVTLGKPMGNGHPIGAVVTTPEIAASFDDGMEYFNTFGGNPVSCAAGLAVLDVLEEEGLLANARVVGARLLEGLEELMGRHALIGDVRGRGLYVGAELVLDRDGRTPAGPHASYVANRMRELGILISTDGPDHNVLKIKPPMVFTAADADRLLETLDRVLGEDAVRVG